MLSHPIIASEAIHTISVPCIKAWERDDHGNVAVLQQTTFVTMPNGEIELRHVNGHTPVIPLFITAKYIAQEFGLILIARK